VRRDEGPAVEQRGLARPRAARDDQVAAQDDALLQERHDARIGRAEPHQVVGMQHLAPEATDRQTDLDRQRRDDRVHRDPSASLHRPSANSSIRRPIGATMRSMTAHGRSLLKLKASLQHARPLDENLVRAVDHDLAHRGIGHQPLQRPGRPPHPGCLRSAQVVQVRRQRLFAKQDVLEHLARIGAQLRAGQLPDVLAAQVDGLQQPLWSRTRHARWSA
jgi:hypothetical protein